MKTLSTKTTYTCPILKVEEREMEWEDGQRETRWVVVRQPYVGIIAITTERRVVMIEEARSDDDTLALDFPGGKTEKFDMTEAELISQAKTELQEETGYISTKIELLVEDRITKNWYERQIYYFLATELIPGKQKLEPGENISVVEFTFGELEQKLSSLPQHLYVPVHKLLERYAETI